MRVEALAASLGVSKGGFYWHFKDRQALLEEMLDTWEKTVAEDVIAHLESRAGRPASQAAAALRAGPVGRFRGRAGASGLVAPRQRGGQAPAPGRQPAHGVPALAVRAVLRRRERRRGAQHAGLLAVHRQLLHRRRHTATRRGRRCCNSRSTGCSASRGTEIAENVGMSFESDRYWSTTAIARSAPSARTRSRGSGRTPRSSPGSSPIWTIWGSPRRRRPRPCAGSRSTARSARDTRR